MSDIKKVSKDESDNIIEQSRRERKRSRDRTEIDVCCTAG
jgi:hypothetical protein